MNNREKIIGKLPVKDNMRDYYFKAFLFITSAAGHLYIRG